MTHFGVRLLPARQLGLGKSLHEPGLGHGRHQPEGVPLGRARSCGAALFLDCGAEGTAEGVRYGPKASRRRGVAVGLLSLLTLGLAAPAQVQTTAPPVLVVPAAAAPASSGAAKPDPLLQLMTSQPPIDTESPVTAQAEFDPPVVVLGGHLIYRLTLNAMNEVIKLPDTLPAPAGLELSPGARSQTYQYGGPKIVPRTTINFRVRPTSLGSFVMPSFVVTAYNKAVTVPMARVTVVPAGAPDAAEAQRLVVELPPGDIYVGQALNVRVVALDPSQPGAQLQGLSQVQVSGDSFLADTTVSRIRREAVVRQGRAYPALIYELTLTPIREGTHTFSVHGHAMISRVIQGPPGVVFQGTTSSSLLESDPVTVPVKSLPREGQSPGFTGAIGTFALEPPRLSTNVVRAGEPVTLTITVRGQGNIGRVVPPKLAPMREWQVFPPSLDPTPASVIQQRGFCSFAYTLIPLSDRIKATPAIPFSYFDPQKATYVNLTIPPVPLTVKPALGGVTLATPLPSSLTVSEGSQEPERELVLTGLAETPGRRVRSLVPWQERPWFAALQVLPGLGLVGLWLWDRHRRHLEQHPEVLLKRRAKRGLRRQLRLARKAAAAGDPSRFVAAAVDALREACAPHTAATPQALVCADVLAELPAPARTGPDGQMVRRLFAAADAQRFGGLGPNGAELLQTRPQLERLLRQLKAKL